MRVLNGVKQYDYFNKITDSPFWVIASQDDFNAVVTRTSANNYKIRDEIKSLYFKYLAANYAFSGFLSGGDTYGILKTNNCARIIFDGGTFFNVGDTAGYFEVNTQYAYLENVWIKGTGSIAAAVTKSLYINAKDVTCIKCRVSNRLSNTAMYGIFVELTANAEIRPTSQFYGCQVHDLSSSGDIHGFYQTHLSNGCYVYTLSSTNGSIYGFNACREGQANHVFSISANVVKGFTTCYRVTGCYAETLDSDFSHAFGFDICTEVVGCKAYDVDSSAGKSMGFYSCTNVVGCTANDIDSSADDAFGFRACSYVTGCLASKIDHSGAVASQHAYGFESCAELGACYATDIDTNGAGGVANGFANCTYAAAFNTDEAANAGNDYIDTADEQVTNKNSTGAIFT
jgi:hypothetical protein